MRDDMTPEEMYHSQLLQNYLLNYCRDNSLGTNSMERILRTLTATIAIRNHRNMADFLTALEAEYRYCNDSYNAIFNRVPPA